MNQSLEYQRRSLNPSLEFVEAKASQQVNLLDFYQPMSSVYFSSPKGALLARPPFAALLGSDNSDLAERAADSLQFAAELGFNNAVVIGAIPFDVSERAYLRVSTNILQQERQAIKTGTQQVTGIDNYTIAAKPAPETYLANVKEALLRFERGELDKVVLSRTLEVNCEEPPDIKALVKNLAAKNPRGYTFAVDLCEAESSPANKGGRTLIGASPELLVSRVGTRVIANPLAGSEPRNADPKIDQERARKLLRSNKDRREHALVIKAIEHALMPFCRWLHVPKEPTLVSTETMWHLATHIEGELFDLQTSSLALALALHPTPAVCGYPTTVAHRAIREIESHERGLFTGMVGWCDGAGDGEWAVTIRCAEVEQKKIRLYAGAGIVAGSDPEKELAETGSKFNTMLNAMGIPGRDFKPTVSQATAARQDYANLK